MVLKSFYLVPAVKDIGTTRMRQQCDSPLPDTEDLSLPGFHSGLHDHKSRVSTLIHQQYQRLLPELCDQATIVGDRVYRLPVDLFDDIPRCRPAS